MCSEHHQIICCESIEFLSQLFYSFDSFSDVNDLVNENLKLLKKHCAEAQGRTILCWKLSLRSSAVLRRPLKKDIELTNSQRLTGCVKPTVVMTTLRKNMK